MIKAEWTNKDSLDLQPTCNQLATTDGDLISRQGAIDALKLFGAEHNAIAVIKGLPSAEPPYQYSEAYVKQIRAERDYLQELVNDMVKPKTGRWIEIPLTNHTYKCSECGRLLVNVTDGKNNVSKHYPFCHCGADMRGGEVE